MRSVYVPAESSNRIKEAHRAWQRFQAIGTEIATENRERFLHDLQREKPGDEEGKGAEKAHVIEVCRRQMNFARRLSPKGSATSAKIGCGSIPQSVCRCTTSAGATAARILLFLEDEMSGEAPCNMPSA